MRAEDAIEVILSFDTTGSMATCLMSLRHQMKAVVKTLFHDIPNLRVGVIAHGDYCDASSTYVIKILDLTADEKKIVSFVNDVPSTGGGDAPECYELVLHEARKLSWTSGKSKVLVVIGDDVPHGPEYSMNTKKIDWRNELGLLLESQINVYGVQCLNRKHASKFYEEIARKTGGFHLSLDQFSNIVEVIKAVAYKQKGDDVLKSYQDQVVKEGRMNRNVAGVFGTLLGTAAPAMEYGVVDLQAVPPGRFQVLKVDADCDIKGFCVKNGLTFKTGRGFYEFTKRVEVQPKKEVVLRHRKTGDMFTGLKAREMLGLPHPDEGETMPISPSKELLAEYVAFIMSTSNNRKLLGGTEFLYEVDDWEGSAAAA